MILIIHKSKSVRDLNPLKNGKSHFAKVFPILATKPFRCLFKTTTRKNQPLCIFRQLWWIFLPSIRPFSLTKRAIFRFFNGLVMLRRYRKCWPLPRYPFWILFLRRVQNGAQSVPASLCLADRDQNFWEKIFSRPKNSHPIGFERLINRTIRQSKKTIRFR